MVVALAGLGVVTLFLLLATLGSMREVVLMRGEVEALAQLVKRPPPPSFVDDVIPPAFAKLIETHQQSWVNSGSPESIAVSFVSPRCGPCENLVTGVRSALDEGLIQVERLLFVAWALDDAMAKEFAEACPGHAVPDIGGRLARVLEIRGTPTVLVVDPESRRVLDYTLEGSAQWITARLTSGSIPQLTR